jgi:hypothetical protein
MTTFHGHKPVKTSPLSRDAARRFLTHIKIGGGPNGDCWIWTGAVSEKGYGRFKVDGKVLGSHRVAFMHFRGELGELMACHHCDHPSCVRPDHLFKGTARDNVVDAIQKGRFTDALEAFKYCRASLGEQHIASVTALCATCSTVTEVAAALGVGRQSVTRHIKRFNLKRPTPRRTA